MAIAANKEMRVIRIVYIGSSVNIYTKIVNSL
jgi:hypothetical protein